MQENQYESLSNHEKDSGSGESANEVLYAIHDTDPATGEEFWYIRDKNTGERTPIDTKEDEEGVTREILEDGTLGREVVQDLSDDPERVRNLYGSFGAEESLPADQKLTATPIALSSESLPDSPLVGTNQAHANALSSETQAIKQELTESSPTKDEIVENPSEFSENTTEYRNKLQNSLNSTTALLMQKADTLNGLDMPDAASQFANKTEEIHSIISSQIESAGDDYSKLTDIYAKYLNGDSSSVMPQIDPTLSTDSSTIKFNELLAQTTTIPELTYIADKLVESRHNLKNQKLEELKNAQTAEEQRGIIDEMSKTENINAEQINDPSSLPQPE